MGQNSNGQERVCLVSGVRTPFIRMGTDMASQDVLDLLVFALEGLVNKQNLHGEIIDEVALGTVFFHPNYWNTARDAVLKSSLSPLTPALGIQRACATSLESAVTIANKIRLGQIRCGIAGGAESMSNIALFLKPSLAKRFVKFSKAKSLGQKVSAWKGVRPSDFAPKSPPGAELATGKTMGQHCEEMAKTWKIGREEQDRLSLASHQNGVKAFKSGFYNDLILEFQGSRNDNNLRADTSLEKLAKLKTSFDFTPAGTLTAGNSSPFTDGAAVCLLASESYAKEKGWPIVAIVKDFETKAIDLRHEGLLMAPAYAAPKMLDRNKLKLQDFDFYEIHEAFAAQVLCTLKAWNDKDFCSKNLGLDRTLGEIPREKLNTVGGSVALGHPFGATGSRLMATMGKLLQGHKNGPARGLISVCTGGGMGTVMILETP